MDSNIIIYILLLAIFLPIIVYFTLRTLKALKMKKIEKIEEPLEDRTYNLINSTRAISTLLKNRGYDTSPADVLIAKAEEEYKLGNYTSAYAHAINAKRILEKIKDSQPEAIVPAQRSEISPNVEKELSIISEEETEKEEEKKETEEEYHSPSYIIKQRYPENYLQSKFAISVVASKIEHVDDERVRKAAMFYYERARKEFEDENYTNALRYAIKCRKIIDGECPPEEGAEETFEEEEVLEEEIPAKLLCPSCKAEVEEGDEFCWKCGASISLRCSKCGKEAKSKDIFCRKCGARLR